jgi:hypothetical protein
MTGEERQRDEWRADFWKLASGLPYHGWRRLTHSILVPIAITVILGKAAERIFG